MQGKTIRTDLLFRGRRSAAGSVLSGAGAAGPPGLRLPLEQLSDLTKASSSVNGGLLDPSPGAPEFRARGRK